MQLMATVLQSIHDAPSPSLRGKHEADSCSKRVHHTHGTIANSLIKVRLIAFLFDKICYDASASEDPQASGAVSRDAPFHLWNQSYFIIQRTSLWSKED